MKRVLRGFVPAVLLLAVAAVAWAQGDSAAPGGGGLASHMSQKYGFTISLPNGGTLLTPESSGWPWSSQDVVTKADEAVPAAGTATGTAPATGALAKGAPGVDNSALDASAAGGEMAADSELKSGVAFDWYGGAGPVKEVLVHCYSFHTPVMESTFKAFSQALHDSFTKLDEAREAEAANSKASQVKQAVGLERNTKYFNVSQVTPAAGVDGSKWWVVTVRDQRDVKKPINYSILSTFAGSRIYSVTLFYDGELSDVVKNTGVSIRDSLRDPHFTGPFGVEPLLMDQTGLTPYGGAPVAPKPAT